MTDEIDPIPADEARRLLQNAIRARLGDNWDDERGEWVLISGHDYMARLTDGKTQLDFQVDLLGEVTVEEREAGLEQHTGRLIAWMFLLGSLALAFILARIAGYL